MLITKLEMKNFGPYKGVFKLDFKKREKRNIEIIWGTNGSGKTHIFNAIKWCLYGYDPSPRDKTLRQGTRKDAWEYIYGTNKMETPPPSAYMYVCLWFEETLGEIINHYILKRSVRPRSSAPVTVFNSTQIDIDVELNCDGERVYNPREKVESILPIAASQFFMFHGEDLRDMSQKHLESTENAIELILEAETFRQGIKDLKRIGRNVDRELNVELGKISEVKNFVESKNKKTEDIEQNENDLEEATKELEGVKQGITQIEQELSIHAASRMTMERLIELRRQKSQFNDDKKKLLSRRNSLINQLPSFVILPELIKILQTKQSIQDKREKIRDQILEYKGRLRLTQDISKLEKCICGNEITEIERKFIETQDKFYQKKIAELQSQNVEEDPTYFQVRETIVRIKSADPDFETLEKDIYDLDIRLDELDSNIDRIEKHLSGIDEEKIQNLTKERGSLYEKKGSLEEQIKTIEKEKKRNEEFRERFIRIIKQREKATLLSTSLDEQYDLTQKCIQAFQFVLTRLSVLRKKQIAEYSTHYIKQLTNKPEEFESINIDDRYNVQLMDSNESIIRRDCLSTGEREVVALSFILGLKYASEKKAPLILDTFFVHLDESHYSNIVRELPNFANQIILILTDLEYKNLNERAPESFFESVNHIWKTNRIQAEERSEIELTRGFIDE